MESSVRTIAVLLTGLYAFVLLHNLMPHGHDHEGCDGTHAHLTHTHAQDHDHHSGHDHGHVHEFRHAYAASNSDGHAFNDHTTACTGTLKHDSGQDANWYKFLKEALAELHQSNTCASHYIHLVPDAQRALTKLVISPDSGIEPIADFTGKESANTVYYPPRLPEYAQQIVRTDSPLRAPPSFS